MYPSQGHNIEDASQQRPPSLPTPNNRGVEEWKEKKNLQYDPARLMHIEQSPYRAPSTVVSIDIDIITLVNFEI